MFVTGRLTALVAFGAVPVIVLSTLGVSAWLVMASWLVLCTVAALADVSAAARLDAVSIEREIPARARLGEPVESAVLVTNSGKRHLRGLLRDGWQPTAGAPAERRRLDVPAGERRRIDIPLRPRRRGERTTDFVAIRAAGPLRLAGRQRRIPAPGALRVLPPFASRRHLPSRVARLRELDGSSSVQVRGPGTEFDSLRGYVRGDDVRAIDWRATARRTDLVVRTWRPERDRRVLLVLDVSRLSAARLDEGTRLEAQIEAALLLAALATRAGDQVELVAVDRGVRARVAGERGPALLAAIADATVPLTPALVEPDWPRVVRVVQERVSHRALVVLLTALEPAAVEYGLLPALGPLARRHQVVVASAADPAVAALRDDRGADAFGVAAAERTDLEREAAAAALRRLGVEVVHAGPEQLAPDLADAYLALKAAGRL